MLSMETVPDSTFNISRKWILFQNSCLKPRRTLIVSRDYLDNGLAQDTTVLYIHRSIITGRTRGGGYNPGRQGVRLQLTSNIAAQLEEAGFYYSFSDYYIVPLLPSWLHWLDRKDLDCQTPKIIHTWSVKTWWAEEVQSMVNSSGISRGKQNSKFSLITMNGSEGKGAYYKGIQESDKLSLSPSLGTPLAYTPKKRSTSDITLAWASLVCCTSFCCSVM